MNISSVSPPHRPHSAADCPQALSSHKPLQSNSHVQFRHISIDSLCRPQLPFNQAIPDSNSNEKQFQQQCKKVQTAASPNQISSVK